VTLAAGERIDPGARLERAREDIRRYREDLERLTRREQGILGEIERIGAEQRLREAELAELRVRLEDVTGAIDTRSADIRELEAAQVRRRSYLGSRVRGLYVDGPASPLRRLVGGDEVRSWMEGLRYASWLAERDARVLADLRADGARLHEERDDLVRRRDELSRLESDLAAARARVDAVREARSGLLTRIRDDQQRHRAAIDELTEAALDFERLVERLSSDAAPASLDVRAFRGLLTWPADGELEAGFGTIVHPKFKTRVPHPGIDLAGADGDDVRSVFDGRVAYASWMRGYGLTAIVDHGGGVLSVYAHASALLAGEGDEVLRGQTIGKIGETGSLRGPYLYFELRVDGQAVDPLPWLRPR
jgi:septal ring factor EnvC (AmiA/AmiB activator)